MVQNKPKTEQTQIELEMLKQVLESLDLDYDSCALYGAQSPSCVETVERWREVLRRHPEYIRVLAELYSEFTGCPETEELMNTLLDLFLRVKDDILEHTLFVSLNGILAVAHYYYYKHFASQ